MTRNVRAAGELAGAATADFISARSRAAFD
jgi:hypothetical protein